MKVLSITCPEEIYNEFYEVADKKPRGKTYAEVLKEMIEAYKKALKK